MQQQSKDVQSQHIFPPATLVLQRSWLKTLSADPRNPEVPKHSGVKHQHNLGGDKTPDQMRPCFWLRIPGVVPSGYSWILPILVSCHCNCIIYRSCLLCRLFQTAGGQDLGGRRRVRFEVWGCSMTSWCHNRGQFILRPFC